MRHPAAVRDARGNRDRPVDPGRDQPVDALGLRQPVDALLVLRGDERPPVGEGEPDRARVPVGGDDEEPVLAGGGEEAELRRPGA